MAEIEPPNGFAIAREKITGYLLNVDHPEGGPKAAYFLARGFSRDEPSAFAEALLQHASPMHLVRLRKTLWGVKFIFEGPLVTPDGRNPRVRSIWNVAPDSGGVAALASAYTF